MIPDVEQVIEVPKLEDGAPLLAVLREPRVAEQLVDVPVPHKAILADGPLAPRVGKERRRQLVDGRHQPHQEGPPGGIHRQPRAVFKCWALVTMVRTSLCSCCTNSSSSASSS